MTISQIREKLVCVADTVGRTKDGGFIARHEFFYRHGYTSEMMAASVKAAIPEAVIVGHGEIWKPFRGGASTANSSHWWVKFTV